tara:strand:- start:62 stop:271 length:210 start_codon:yes stop_codon:yes gene_type:complete
MSELKANLVDLTMYIKNHIQNEIKEVHYIELLSKVALIYKNIDTEIKIKEIDDDDIFESYNEDYIDDYI